MSSHDVVARVRRLYGQKRTGHAGTLDPSAVGVLLLCLGRATRLLEYLVGHDKAYTGEIVLGVETDSYDADGEVLETCDAAALTADRVAEAMTAFVGDIQQVPPAISAKKIDGQPAYRLARRGLIPDLPAVPVRVDAFALLGFQPGTTAVAEVAVSCGSGTYIRSLAHDLGDALGVGAHLRGLVRTRVHTFDRDQCVPLDTLAELDSEARLALLRPLRECLGGLPTVVLPEPLWPLLRDGKLLPTVAPRGPVALLSAEGEVLAIADAQDDGVHPHKVLL
ncbi:MAG: tRNA pseudouridine(55) synthase TruB [Armatimonadetes bacterium]|nr:tRNA pseudouridine(55) synthase TruB [Armatimonadota bacterium]